MVYPDYDEAEESGGSGRMNYPRPISEPPSPNSSRATTPAPSEAGSSDEVDSEAEVHIRQTINKYWFIYGTLKIKFPLIIIAVGGTHGKN